MNGEMTKIMHASENMYRLLARLYKKEIDAALLSQLKSMKLPYADADAQTAANTPLAAGWNELGAYLASVNVDEETLTALAADYAKVFLAAGSAKGFAAVPYESVYTSKKRIIMQEAWEKVRAVYREKSLVIGNAAPDYMEDHIACELEYMAWLCTQGKRSENEAAAHKNIEDQLAFLNTHLLAWTPTFYEDIVKYGDTAFYKAVGQITVAYLTECKNILEMLLLEENDAADANSVALDYEAMDKVIAKLSKKYRIFAPKCLPNRGAKKGTDLIRYGEIHSAKEIVYDRQSDFSPKEVIYPVMQTMFYFTESDVKASELKDSKDLLIFARPCDINGLKRLDNIFIHNGQADVYYTRMRDRVKFAMMECPGSFDKCFCVSMGTNKTQDYAFAVKFEDAQMIVSIKEDAFAGYFGGAAHVAYTPSFVEENDRKAVIPQINDKAMLKTASELEFWSKYDDQCIGCGGCNTVCMTCSCFDTVDVIYNESSRDGERRRVWSSCMLEDFTKTAGGGKARKTPGANMRFKTLHKVYDYHARFGGDDHMCVGCGRCDMRCPKEISFYETINTLSSELEKVTKEGK